MSISEHQHSDKYLLIEAIQSLMASTSLRGWSYLCFMIQTILSFDSLANHWHGQDKKLLLQETLNHRGIFPITFIQYMCFQGSIHCFCPTLHATKTNRQNSTSEHCTRRSFILRSLFVYLTLLCMWLNSFQLLRKWLTSTSSWSWNRLFVS